MIERTRLAGVLGMIAVLAAVWTCPGAARADAAATAKDILDATGVRGGLIVHIGCGDGTLTAALRASDAYVVHGLDVDAANVAKARQTVTASGAYGTISIDRLTGGALPYVDNLVNLIVADDLGAVSRAEVLRVLRPGGVAYVGGQKTVKPRPGQIDEWTHYLYDASNNAVSHDTVVAPPRHLQWDGGPQWSRHHDHMASTSAMVSAGGRVFHITDEGPVASIQLPPEWTLVARDAFNGKVLWKRSIAEWFTHIWPAKSGPARLPRRLVAVGDRVYVTLGITDALSELNAATGETIRTYEGTKATEEILFSNGVLFLLVDPTATPPGKFELDSVRCWTEKKRVAQEQWHWRGDNRDVVAVQAETGKTLWRHRTNISPLTLAADEKRVIFHDGGKVVCLDRTSGKRMWASEEFGGSPSYPTNFSPTLVLYDGVVLYTAGKTMTSLSASTGKKLWTAKQPRTGHNSPLDILVADGLVWSGETASGRQNGVYTGRNPRTGKIVRQFPPTVKTYWFHHRCHRAKGTDRFMLPSRTGIEFIDIKRKTWDANHWIRGGCIYGIMPCNGMTYTAPHSCACYMDAKLTGFNAVAPASPSRRVPKIVPDAGRLQKGAAYGAIQNPHSEIRHGDWPTYRHDATRSGFTTASVPAAIRPQWQAELGGKLSTVTVAEGKLFVSQMETHTVHALDSHNGKPVWRFTAGGRVDSPPTFHQGRVIFGSRDGFVYCLRAADGELVWRFRAAPLERRLLSYEQVESVWPVHGSVLITDGVVQCVAGRSMFLDGGLRMLRLDAATGRKLSETVMDGRMPKTGQDLQVQVKGLDMAPALPDVLASDGRNVYMRTQVFDMKGMRRSVERRADVADQLGDEAHLFSPNGFLDGNWLHRSYWVYGKSFAGGHNGWFRAGRFAPSGRILVFNDDTVYGYGRKPELYVWSSVLEYRLFAVERQGSAAAIQRVREATAKMEGPKAHGHEITFDRRLLRGYPVPDISAYQYRWSHNEPGVVARAMVLAGETLFVAGPADVLDEEAIFADPHDPNIQARAAEQSAALKGSKGALLWAVSPGDGKRLCEIKLDAPPVWDGMAAAGGRLYLATTDGKVHCFSGQ